MYIVKRVLPTTGELAYYTYDGWVRFPDQGPLDLSDCVLFTEGERKANVFKKQQNDEWQWYGSYKR